MNYPDWLSNWPVLFIILSIPTLLMLLAFLAFWQGRSRWKAPLCLLIGYLVVANFAGLFVYQWVPTQYTRDQNWSWPPADERSLGLAHGKHLAIAADRGVSAPTSVYKERVDFFKGWLQGPTMAGLALVVFAMSSIRLFQRQISKLIITVIALLLLAGCGGTKEKLLDAASGATSTPAVSPIATPTTGERSTTTPTAQSIPTAEPTSTSRARTATLQLAIVDNDRDVSLVNHDGTGKKKLLDAEQCPKPMKLIWSPTGDKLACLSYEHIETKNEGNLARPFSRYTVVIVDIEGQALGKIGPLESFTWSLAWSPTGQHLAYGVVTSTTPRPLETYYVADYTGKTIAKIQGGERWLTNDLLQGIQGNLIWSPDGSVLAFNADSGEVATYNLTYKTTVGSGKGADRPLAWVIDGKALVVASKYDPEAMLPRYEANLLSKSIEQMRRVSELDNSNRFWLSPDGNRAAFLHRDRSRQIFAGLAMLDFGSVAVTPIPDSIIRYGSETIPYNHASFSRDGSFFAWADADVTIEVFRVRANGTGMRKMVSLPYGQLAFSPDLTKIAYAKANRAGEPLFVEVLNLDGSGATEIGPAFSFAWRP